MSRRAARSAPAALLASLVLAAAALATGLPAGCARDLPCQLNSDCPVGYCQDGVCKQNCVDASRDCPSGYVCNANAQCVPPDSGASTGSGAGGGTTSSSAGTGGATTASSSSTSASSGPSSSSSSTSSSSTSGGTGKQALDLCFSANECASPLICRPMFPGGPKRCTHTCASTGACMTGTVCDAIGAESYCAGDDTGRQCSAATQCNFGCLGQYCTKPCVSGADCPNGYGCMLDQGSNLHICVRAEAPCASSDPSACVGPQYCDESPTLYVGGCTLPCTSALDCPQRAAGLPAWTCSGGMCRRPGDVHGPLQGGYTPAQYVNDCQGQVVNVCNDGQHIDFNAFTIPDPPAATCGATTTSDGAPTDSCVDSCRYQGGCAYGFACVAVGGVGNARIGLCLPTGGIEVGGPCQYDSQCSFGYCRMGTCSRDCSADGLCPGGEACVAGGGPAVEGQPFRRCQ